MTDTTDPSPPVSLLGPLHQRMFAVIWSATVVSNIGGWMYSAAAAWLMTLLDADPLMVSSVQVAASLPMVFFALPAGALADILDLRRVLIGAETFIAIASTLLAVLVWGGSVTPWSLLLLTFMIETGSAVAAPGWQAAVTRLVPRSELRAAIALNSLGVNASRAVGPALGGVLAAGAGIGAPFWLNAGSNLGVIGALLAWRPREPRKSRLPAEHFRAALHAGLRHAQNNRHLRATLVRAVAFFLFSSGYWALLPLVVRNQVHGGSSLYGLLLGVIGVSAIGGAIALPRASVALGPNRLAALGSIGTAAAMATFGVAHSVAGVTLGCVLAGLCWSTVVPTLNASAQVALPEWVRGRGLAIYVMVMFGTMTAGGGLWGEVARLGAVPLALLLSAAGMLIAVPATWRWQLYTGAAVDFAPSMHWSAPTVSGPVARDAGPALVTVSYRVRATDRERFLEAIHRLSHERVRDGAYQWGVYEDVAEHGRFLEEFLLESWTDHLRQHERVTNSDRRLQERIRAMLTEPPTVTHLVAARVDSLPV